MVDVGITAYIDEIDLVPTSFGHACMIDWKEQVRVWLHELLVCAFGLLTVAVGFAMVRGFLLDIVVWMLLAIGSSPLSPSRIWAWFSSAAITIVPWFRMVMVCVRGAAHILLAGR